MKIKHKLRGRAGFSLAETLIATLILMLVSMLLAQGVPVVRNIFERVTVGVNARVLLSTTISALRNELGTAKNIAVSADKQSVTYYSMDIHARSKIYMGTGTTSDDNISCIRLQEYIMLDEKDDVALGAGGIGTPRRLVPARSATEDLYVTFKEVSTDGNALKFTEVKVKRKDHDVDQYAELPELYVRAFFGQAS